MGVTGEAHGGVAVHRIDPVARETGGIVTKNCRANSPRGQTDPSNRSYRPVEAVCRTLNVLRSVNRQRIATVHSIHAETGIPKPTVVRMLGTLMDEGYVLRDNMCGGYRMSSRATEFTDGYAGIGRVIEVARPLIISLTRKIEWPLGLGVIDGDAIAIQFWTGTISPWAHTNTLLGLRPDPVAVPHQTVGH
jgi:IclR family mhp operon transcriptional activator